MPKSRTQPDRALDHPLADRVAVGVVVVDRLAPGGLVLVGEVGAERLHRLDAGGADVVVDDVEDHGEPDLVGRRDEPREPVRAAVGGVRGRDVDAVVAPAAAPGNSATGMISIAVTPSSASSRRCGIAASNVPSGRERADVQLVDTSSSGRRRREAPLGHVAQGAGVEHPRRARAARRAASGCTDRAAPAVEHEPVVVARRRLGQRLVDPVAHVLERVLAVLDPQRDRLRPRRPDAELGRSVGPGRAPSGRSHGYAPDSVAGTRAGAETRASRRAVAARASVDIGDEPDGRERRQRELGRERLTVPRDRLGLDAAEVADVAAAVEASSRC